MKKILVAIALGAALGLRGGLSRLRRGLLGLRRRLARGGQDA